MKADGECVSECVCVCVNASPVHTWDGHLHPRKGGKNKSVQRCYQKNRVEAYHPNHCVCCSVFLLHSEDRQLHLTSKVRTFSESGWIWLVWGSDLVWLVGFKSGEDSACMIFRVWTWRSGKYQVNESPYKDRSARMCVCVLIDSTG